MNDHQPNDRSVSDIKNAVIANLALGGVGLMAAVVAWIGIQAWSSTDAKFQELFARSERQNIQIEINTKRLDRLEDRAKSDAIDISRLQIEFEVMKTRIGHFESSLREHRQATEPK